MSILAYVWSYTDILVDINTYGLVNEYKMSFCPLQVDTCNLDAKIWNGNYDPSLPSPAGVSTP